VAQKVKGNVRALSPSLLKKAQKLFQRKIEADELVSLDLAREIYRIASELSRRVGVLISREGEIEEVFLGSRDILYLPDLGRYRLGEGRLRKLRLVYSDLTKGSEATIPHDIVTDLEKLRLDAVVGVKETGQRTSIAYAFMNPAGGSTKEFLPDLSRLDLDFTDYITNLEYEISSIGPHSAQVIPNGALLVHVSDRGIEESEKSLEELNELANTAGVKVLDKIIQKKKPDPRSVLGKGKLEEVVLHCIRIGAEVLIFDQELEPTQWRIITNSTELKILDRSMVILDIFAQRAQSREGVLQVELAQLKYNLPRLVEKDAGLSRLSGGIGGRGPGETKLEIGRRRIRDRISELEKRIDAVSGQRELRKKRRKEQEIPLVAILGYTNVGKSTLFNRMTGSSVVAENKLFATLDPYQRRVSVPVTDISRKDIIISDTVGFIRDLPKELRNAFRATLEELYDASLALHVIDGSDPYAIKHYQAVNSILSSMELSGLTQIIIINKSDLMTQDKIDQLQNETDGIVISAVKGKGLKEILEVISKNLFGIQDLESEISY